MRTKTNTSLCFTSFICEVHKLTFHWIYWFKKVELRGCDLHKEEVGPIWPSSGVAAMFHLKDPTSCQ